MINFDEENKNYTEEELMNIDFSYPDPSDPDLQEKLYKKMEFYYHRVPIRPIINNYDEIKKYRHENCERKFALRDHQAMIGNFINPDTPYKGVLLFHGMGSGKCIGKDSYVYINNKLLKISSLWEFINEKFNIIDINDKTNIIDSFNDKILIKNKISKFYRERIDSYVKKIILDDGSEILLTYSHKLNLVEKGWTNEYNLGDYIYTSNYIENNSNKFIDEKEIDENIDNMDFIDKILESNIKCIDYFLYKYCLNKGFIIPKYFILKNLSYDNRIKIIYLCKFLGLNTKFILNNLYISRENSFNSVFKSRIMDIKIIYYKDYVYDFEMNDYHNYLSNTILCHNTCAAISITENCKEIVKKYNTKIVILTGGPLIKENWKQHILLCSGDNYNIVDDVKNRQAKMEIMQYYRFMSYKSFYKHVIGEKIMDKQLGKRGKILYRKTEEGEFERDIAVDRIYNLNNTILVVDEAHNFTGNNYGKALKQIIKNSINLRVVLLTGTPMKNLVTDIVELINFIRPNNDQIKVDEIFKGDKGHELVFKEGGEEYLKKMLRGYISSVKSRDPLTFPIKVEMGEKLIGTLKTKVIGCKMSPFQEETYERSLIDSKGDSLNRKSEAVVNIVLPGLSSNKKELKGFYAGDGLEKVINQIKIDGDILNEKLSMLLYNNKDEKDIIKLTHDEKSITGKFLKLENLYIFSTKFHNILTHINTLYKKNDNLCIVFIYSNLVKMGIQMFSETLLQNGYLDYQVYVNTNKINSDTKCYYCGETYHNHIVVSEEVKKMPIHSFSPATFISITGKSTEDVVDDNVPEEKMEIIKNIFNNYNNIEGKYIKIVLGSRVMNEGISLKNNQEVHILDAYYNFGRSDQVSARSIRHCSNIKLASEKNPFPKVKIFKYVVRVKNGLSSEEDLYIKAEKKYIMIKKVEKIMTEVSFDCPLNIGMGIFLEEVENLKNCKIKNCKDVCDHADSIYKCESKLLNEKYYDEKTYSYKTIPLKDLDKSTFTINLAKTEIDFARRKIKEMYLMGLFYFLDEIVNYVKNNYNENKKELFKEFYVYKALNSLIPKSENDFNNFNNFIVDKNNKKGYLINIDNFYIFQPFGESENIPLYYRDKININIKSNITLKDYLSLKDDVIEKNEELEKKDIKMKYNYEDVYEYYEKREEFDIVGFIDIENDDKDYKDLFKIREKRAKILEKRRAAGVPSFKGAVCFTSKNKLFLEKVIKKLNIKKLKKNYTRSEICDLIKKRMLFLEKYSNDKKKNKFTYIMIPSNHPKYIFPYNLEDRFRIIKKDILDLIEPEFLKEEIINLKIKGESVNNYLITVPYKENNTALNNYMTSKNSKKVKDKWVLEIN